MANLAASPFAGSYRLVPLDYGAVLSDFACRRKRRVRGHERIVLRLVMLVDKFGEELRCSGVHVNANEVVRAVDRREGDDWSRRILRQKKRPRAWCSRAEVEGVNDHE